MVDKDLGSLTKEPPLATLDATIRAITPGMSYGDLLAYARGNTHRDAPGLVRKRFLTIESNGTIRYDHFLSLAAVHDLESPFIRKIMYFVWAYRDQRIREFICSQVADRNGVWRERELRDKANSKFFERWLQRSTAKKARSNFEFFLVETRIYDPKKRAIHLELQDGWLEHAALVAAQHEKDVVLREELLANPAEFLATQGWLGLINVSRTKLPKTTAILLTDGLPLEDEGIKTPRASSITNREWDRSSPTTSAKKTVLMNIDLVSRERASKSHWLLEKILADSVRRSSLTPKYNQNIDMYFETVSGMVLVEIKSCTDNNFHSQLRKGISQLFEYQFMHKELFPSRPTMLLLMESIPPPAKTWLVDYAESLGIVLAWKEPHKHSIVTRHSRVPELTGIVGQI